MADSLNIAAIECFAAEIKDCFVSWCVRRSSKKVYHTGRRKEGFRGKLKCVSLKGPNVVCEMQLF